MFRGLAKSSAKFATAGTEQFVVVVITKSWAIFGFRGLQ
jgi:hypothetical protein